MKLRYISLIGLLILPILMHSATDLPIRITNATTKKVQVSIVWIMIRFERPKKGHEDWTVVESKDSRRPQQLTIPAGQSQDVNETRIQDRKSGEWRNIAEISAKSIEGGFGSETSISDNEGINIKDGSEIRITESNGRLLIGIIPATN